MRCQISVPNCEHLTISEWTFFRFLLMLGAGFSKVPMLRARLGSKQPKGAQILFLKGNLRFLVWLRKA